MINIGQSVTLTAHVDPTSNAGDGSPTWIYFYDGTTFIGEAATDASANAVITASFTEARTHALTAALHYYRALLRYPAELRRGNRPITTPTLLIWGERDPYLGIRLIKRLDRWVSDLQIVRIPDASHWVQNEAPDRVNQLLIRFFRQ